LAQSAKSGGVSHSARVFVSPPAPKQRDRITISSVKKV